jgi:hypothetical protein
MAKSAADALKRFEVENGVVDAIYTYDREFQNKLRDQKPWSKE